MGRETTIEPGSFDGVYAENLVRVIETSIGVHRRYQFFVWSQSSLQALVPHQLSVCGAYKRARRQVQFEVFNSVVVPPTVLALLADGQSPLMQRAIGAWVDNHGKPLALDVDSLTGRGLEEGRAGLLAAGIVELLIHAVSRPQRVEELESVFMFATPGKRSSEQHRLYLDLLLPHMHSTYLRVQSVEREMNDTSAQKAPKEGVVRSAITDREKQILGWVREGLSNHAIGSELSISPLTVKNHVQKILRKLGAANRAQAVARAMSMNLLGRSNSDD